MTDKKRGRPNRGHVQLTVSITPEQLEWLKKLALRRGWDRSQTVRELLKDDMGVGDE